MRGGETCTANHRCVGSLTAQSRVIKDLQIPRLRAFYPGWHLIHIYFDLEYGDTPIDAGVIDHCPYCDKKLKEG